MEVNRCANQRRYWLFNIILMLILVVIFLFFNSRLILADSNEDKGNITVFAAASMINVTEKIAAEFTSRYGSRVVTVYAASSRLAMQIQFGAPAHVFISANLKWMDYLESKGLLVEESRVPVASNKLVIIAPLRENDIRNNSNKKIIQNNINGGNHYLYSNSSIFEELKNGRLAMGDPDDVPAGEYAREALLNLGLWENVAKKIAPMPNVRSVLSVVERAEAPLGIVYHSDTMASDKVKVIAEIPQFEHQTILYPGAVIVGAPPEAYKFLSYFLGNKAQAIFKENGFLPPSSKD